MNQILGFILQNPDKALTVNAGIFTGSSAKVFDVVVSRLRNNQEIKLNLIAQDAGVTPLYLSELMSDSYIKYSTFLELVAEAHKKLELQIIEDLLRNATEDAHNADPTEKLAIYQNLKEKLSGVSLSKRKYQIYENPTMTETWFENYDKVRPAGIKTGFTLLDKEIGGIGLTDFVLLIGDTNVGKTNLLLNIVLSALRQGKKVLFYSLEMTAAQLQDRLIAIAGQYNAFDIRERAYTKAQLQTTVEQMKLLDLRMIDTGLVTSTDIVNDIINERTRRKIDLVAVDYLQRLNDPKGHGENETQRIANMARRLKNAALSYEIPIITPVQVDKASHKSGKIEVENVADSKVVANEADLALYIYQEEKRASASEVPVLETKLKVVKSRHTRRGLIVDLSVNETTLEMKDDSLSSVLKYAPSPRQHPVAVR